MEKRAIEVICMQIAMIITIIVSAIVAFVVGDFYGQPLHWYLFILIILTGFFINTVILILEMEEDNI